MGILWLSINLRRFYEQTFKTWMGNSAVARWFLCVGAFMKRFVIHTENKDQEWIEQILSIGFDGFTVVNTNGYWKGKQEKSLEIILYTSNTELVRAMAERIKHHNKQDAVLIAETECRLELV